MTTREFLVCVYVGQRPTPRGWTSCFVAQSSHRGLALINEARHEARGSTLLGDEKTGCCCAWLFLWVLGTLAWLPMLEPQYFTHYPAPQVSSFISLSSEHTHINTQ